VSESQRNATTAPGGVYDRPKRWVFIRRWNVFSDRLLSRSADGCSAVPFNVAHSVRRQYCKSTHILCCLFFLFIPYMNVLISHCQKIFTFILPTTVNLFLPRCMHCMHRGLSTRKLSVRLSVCSSIKRLDYENRRKFCQDFYTIWENIYLNFLRRMFGGAAPPTWNFGSNWPRWSEMPIFSRYPLVAPPP